MKQQIRSAVIQIHRKTSMANIIETRTVNKTNSAEHIVSDYIDLESMLLYPIVE